MPEPSRPSRAATLAAIAFLVVFPWVAQWTMWTADPKERRIMPGDAVLQGYPSRHLVHDEFRHGRLPLWNPYQSSGMPLLGDVQVAVFYAPNVALSLVVGDEPLSYMSFQALTIAHFSLTGVLMFLFLRGLGIGIAASVLGAVAHQFNGFHIFHRAHVNMFATVAWLPGVLWLLDAAWRRASSGRGWAWAITAGVAWSQMLMAGHPQMLFLSSLFVGAWAVFRFGGAWRRRDGGARPGRIATRFGVAAGLALAIAAVSLWPALELIGRSARVEGGFDEAAAFSLLPRYFVNLLMPDLFHWDMGEMRIYAGILTLVLALVAWFVPTRRAPAVRFFGVAIGVAVVLALGALTVQGILYQFVPGFESIRALVRVFFFANLGLAVTAAFGCQTLLDRLNAGELARLRRLVRAMRWPVGLVSVFALILCTLITAYYTGIDLSVFFAPNVHTPGPMRYDAKPVMENFATVLNHALLFGVFLVGAVTLVSLRTRRRMPGPALSLALIALMAVDLTANGAGANLERFDPDNPRFGTRGEAAAYHKPKEADGLDEALALLRWIEPGVRIEAHGKVHRNFGQVWRLHFANGYNILDPRISLDRGIVDELRRDMWAVSTVVDGPRRVLSGKRLKLATRTDGASVWVRYPTPAYARFATGFDPLPPRGPTHRHLHSNFQNYAKRPAVHGTNREIRAALADAWPEPFADVHFAVGTTGVVSPANVTIVVFGDGSWCYVDGEEFPCRGRRVHAIAIDPDDGSVVAFESFSRWSAAPRSRRLAAFVDEIPDGSIVAVWWPGGNGKVDDASMRGALRAIGVDPTKAQLSEHFASIGVKGAASATAMTNRSDATGPLRLDVGSGRHGGGDPEFTWALDDYDATRIRLTIDVDRSGLLTVPELDYPGWRATVDGEDTPIVAVNGAQRGIAIKAGKHAVVFDYAPASFRVGGSLSLLALIAAGVGLFVVRRRGIA